MINSFFRKTLPVSIIDLEEFFYMHLDIKIFEQ